jgi:hypothetical protein
MQTTILYSCPHGSKSSARGRKGCRQAAATGTTLAEPTGAGGHVAPPRLFAARHVDIKLKTVDSTVNNYDRMGCAA